MNFDVQKLPLTILIFKFHQENIDQRKNRVNHDKENGDARKTIHSDFRLSNSYLIYFLDGSHFDV